MAYQAVNPTDTPNVGRSKWNSNDQDLYAGTMSVSSEQALTAAGNAITYAGGVKRVTTNADLTLTAAPTIADGQDGQKMLLINTGSNDLTLQDQDTLASSNLVLTANTITLVPNACVEFLYLTSTGLWHQVSSVVTPV